MDRMQEKVLVRRRRRDTFRMRRKALRIGKIGMGHWDAIWQSADHLAKCSCWMCGNPRKHAKGAHRLSLNEKRMLLSWYDECEEVHNGCI